MSSSILLHNHSGSQSAPASAIRVLTPSFSASENQYLSCLWSSVTPYGVEVVLFYPGRPISEIKAEPKLGDVIHLHWIQGFCGFNPHQKLQSWRVILGNLRNFLFFKQRGYRLVWTVHNTISHERSAPKIEHFFRWCLSHLCDDIIVMSEYGRQEVARLYGRKHRVHVVPHGNYIGAYPNQISPEEARQQLGLTPQQTVILYFGQVKPYKGVENLIAAFQKLQGVPGQEVILFIVGACNDAKLKAEIEQAAQINSRIRLHLQFVPDEAIQVYLQACDWVVLPYRHILNSGSALLALSFGRPVIVPRRGALTELITDGQQGLCYDCDRDLTNTLQRALQVTPEQWQHMCHQSYSLAQQYDWSKIGAQLYQIYQQGKVQR